MSFRLVDAGWDGILREALEANHTRVGIVCPFIKEGAVKRLLKNRRPEILQLITRFNLADFGQGVSDIAALRLLLDQGARIRGVRNLHAKLYLFGANRAIVTSANLTDAALLRNHEFGVVAEDTVIVGRCHNYFDDLWRRAGQDLSAARLAEWELTVTRYLAAGAQPMVPAGMGDEGVDAGVLAEPTASPAWVANAEQAFVKFFGTTDNRADRAMLVLDEVRRSGCHWACTYPEDKRPRVVQDGAIMFMGRLVENPNDIVIYGRAMGMRHEPGRDDATDLDLQQRPWKANWPHYVRVHHAEFVAGSLSNGISLGTLMDALESNAFASTQRNAARGNGNVDPRRAFIRQPAVELSRQGINWLNSRLESAFGQYGKLAPTILAQLDWPAIPE